MKILITLVTLMVVVFAMPAFAGEFSQPDSVLFQTASTYVPALKVCRDGNFLKHKSKAAITVPYCADNNLNCNEVKKTLLQPVVSVTKRCVKTFGRDGSQCKEWQSYPLDQSAVRMRTYTSESAASDGKGGRVSGVYKIPPCVKK